MNFRIKHVKDIGYWGQVKRGFFSPWETIGSHVNGFGLYHQGDLEHPISTHNGAAERCSKYERWTHLRAQTPKFRPFEICRHK